MADQVRVFVSHHHSPEEDAFTTRLVADLEAAGADVWVDVVGVGAADFLERINQALESCQWLVLVMTPASLASRWVRTEVHAAIRLIMQGRMRGIIQIVAQPVVQEQIPPTWGVYAHFDATQDYAAALNLTLRELGLSSLVSNPGVPQTSPPPSSPALLPPSRLPPVLAMLGYELHSASDVEFIVPPLCNVAAGAFLMGSNQGEDSEARVDELPQHSVTLPAFQVGKFPLTVAEYAYFLRARGRAAPTGEDGKLYEVSWQTQLRQRLDHPVVRVSWDDAVEYARWLAVRTGHPWRLPTEAEWEKAARWDQEMEAVRRFPWGDRFDAKRCNTIEGKQGTTTPVGTYASGASPYGAQDMAGNVWEWTSSLYLPYPYSATDGREQKNSTDMRVMRGGSWAGVSGLARAAFRYPDLPSHLL